MRATLILCLTLSGILLSGGCIQHGQGQHPAKHVTNTPKPVPAISVCLIRSDLGMADGIFVREADAALAEAAKVGQVAYTPVGPLPVAIEQRTESADIAMPQAGSMEPGTMTIEAATALLDQAAPGDWLVLTSPALLAPALERIGAGKLKARCVVLLDNEGLAALPLKPPVPVAVVRYRVKDVAFLCGVAAAASSANAQFVALASAADPQADEFLKAVVAGAKYQANGAVTYIARVPTDQSGSVTRETFSMALNATLSKAGSYFKPSHYIVSLGRATPSVINGLCSKPFSGYVATGYADYRALWPERTICCAVKNPGAALNHLLAATGGDPAKLAALAPQGYIELGFAEEAIGYADASLYARYNPDGQDIQDAVDAAAKLIRAGELDYPY